MNSFPGTWESPGGGALPEDRNILETMVRETAEETGLVLWAASNRVYCVTFRHKNIWMAKYLAIAETSEKTNCRRLWSDEQEGPRSSDINPIRLRDDEHLDYVWATEEQIRNCINYDPSDTETAGLVMIQSNKDVLSG
jgi:8-oxo-dGTP pyrophosphatase MutT (NUDIX family)